MGKRAIFRQKLFTSKKGFIELYKHHTWTESIQVLTLKSENIHPSGLHDYNHMTIILSAVQSSDHKKNS